jgi:hypothetical protein
VTRLGRAESAEPEAAEIRAQGKVRTQDDQARDDPGPGDERIREALETAAEVAEKTGGLGTPGRPVNRRSPFMIGMTGAFGVAVAYGLIELFIRARSVLIIIGLALFIAAGLDPVVGWLVRHRMPLWAAVLTVIAAALAIAAAFLAAAIPPLASEATALAHQIPHYMHSRQDRNSQLGKLNVKPRAGPGAFPSPRPRDSSDGSTASATSPSRTTQNSSPGSCSISSTPQRKGASCGNPSQHRRDATPPPTQPQNRHGWQ